MLPPRTAEDFDAHLNLALQDLRSLQKEVAHDLFILAHPATLKESPGGRVGPVQIKEKLEQLGYSW